MTTTGTGPATIVAGVVTVIDVAVVLPVTVAANGPNRTDGASNPLPRIVTDCWPVTGPIAGVTDVMTGVDCAGRYV